MQASGFLIKEVYNYLCVCVCMCVVVAVQWSPCGSMLASAGFDAITCIWDRRGGGQSVSQSVNHAVDTFIITRIY